MMGPLYGHASKQDIRSSGCLSSFAPISIGMFFGDEDQDETDELSEEELFLEELFSASYQSDPFAPIDARHQARYIRQRVSNFLAEEAYLEELEAARSAVEFPLDDEDEVNEYLLVSGGQRC